MNKKYPHIANIIRLKDKAQQLVGAVKLEFLSSKLRDEILSASVISIAHMKLKVVEYYAQARVLRCSNFYGTGHFRKNCVQKNESTCKICEEKYVNLKDHQCSGVLKRIHWGGAHVSNDAKSKVVKDYRTGLTRNLLANATSKNVEDTNVHLVLTNFQLMGTRIARQLYATVV